VKRIFLLILPFNFSIISAIDFTYETSITIRNTVTKEYVYEGEKCISRLDWIDDIVPILSFTGQGEFSNVMIRTRIDTAVPTKSGVMEDYDFLLEGDNAPSQYSKHDAYIDKDFSCMFEAGYRLRFSGWEIQPALRFSYINRKWTAQDGYLQYPVYGKWTGDEPKQNIAGTVIGSETSVCFVGLSGYTRSSRGAWDACNAPTAHGYPCRYARYSERARVSPSAPACSGSWASCTSWYTRGLSNWNRLFPPSLPLSSPFIQFILDIDRLLPRPALRRTAAPFYGLYQLFARFSAPPG
jgi:hypothetical protein